MAAIYPQHSAGCKPNQHLTVKTARMSMHIIVHNGCTQYITEQFWWSSLLSSSQSSLLRCYLLE